MAWWVAGKCETITNSASAEAKVEAWDLAGKFEIITNSASAKARVETWVELDNNVL